MVLALANPSLTREDRDPIPSVAAVIVDKSPSQDFGNRTQQTEAVRATLVERLKRIPGLEVRVTEAGAADGETDGTKLFSALSSTLADVPPDRVASGFRRTRTCACYRPKERNRPARRPHADPAIWNRWPVAVGGIPDRGSGRSGRKRRGDHPARRRRARKTCGCRRDRCKGERA